MGFCALNIYLTLVLIIKISDCRQCLKNDDIGWREGNIYKCSDPLYPACCEVYKKFTCCEEPRVKNLREQLQLWGTLSVIALLLFIIYLYYNKDSQSSCSCSCDFMHACATCFRRARNACSRRKSTFEIQDDKIVTTGLQHSACENLSYQNDAFEKFTVT